MKVLIIRFRRVGDAVLTSSICTTLKQMNPDIEIHYVLDQHIGELFNPHPDIDRVITFSEIEKHSLFTYLSKIWKIMRKEKYDVIIDARSTISTMYFSLFSIRSKYRIGFKKSYLKYVHNYRIDSSQIIGYVECMHELLKPLCKESKFIKSDYFRLGNNDEKRLAFRRSMQMAGIDFNKLVVCCAVATRLPYKRWDFEKMKDTLNFLIAEYDAQLIFNFSGEEETIYAKKLYLEMGNNPNIFIDIKADSLKDFASLVSNCHFFFGNEGGPRHISQALGIPSLAIFPPEVSAKVWLPGKNNLFDSIEPTDINESIANDSTFSYDQKFDMITVNEVTNRLKISLKGWELHK